MELHCPTIPDTGFRYARYRLHLQAIDEVKFGNYSGSAFRGGFGYSLLRNLCLAGTQNCHSCDLRQKCTYAAVFEPDSQDNVSTINVSNPPRPFILEPPAPGVRFIAAEKMFELDIILVGSYASRIEEIIYVFIKLGESGIGIRKAKYRVISVSRVYKNNHSQKIYMLGSHKNIPAEHSIPEPPSVYHLNGSVLLRFLTPARIKDRGKIIRSIEFPVLIKNILRRQSLLEDYYCGGSTFSKEYVRDMIDRAGSVKIRSSSLQWHDWKRFSSRKQIYTLHGGIIGYIEYTGDIKPFSNILTAGEIMHIGKNATFGLGQYILV